MLVVVVVVVVVVDNFCIALLSSVHKLTALYNILQHFLSEKNKTKNNECIMFKEVIHLGQLTLYIHKKNSSSLVVVG